jgi:hypothetical protein
MPLVADAGVKCWAEYGVQTQPNDAKCHACNVLEENGQKRGN